MRRDGRLLGLDLGSRRIGVAVTDSGRSVATGVSTIQRSGDRSRDHAAVLALAQEYDVVGVIVGVQYSLDGRAGPAAASALEETDQLRRTLAGAGLDVDTVDERLTTVAAAGTLRAAGRKAKSARSVIDQTAAAVLLQSWIDRRPADGATR